MGFNKKGEMFSRLMKETPVPEKDIETEIMKQGNISLILEDYGDIFSDFDPRPYSERALSDDFLSECRKASRDKKEDDFGLELRLLVPDQKRELADEHKIKRRLKNHFQKHYEEKQQEQKKIKQEGFVWFLLGVILIFAATFLFKKEGLLFNFLFILFEPAGWFTIWNGLDKIFFSVKENKPELEFYRKMAKVRIYFYSY